MERDYTKKLILEGLDCANCADKIEKMNDEHTHDHIHGDEDRNKALIKLLIGALLFAMPTIFKLNQIATVGLYTIAYLTIGYDIVWLAIKNLSKRQIFDENFLMTIATVGAFAIGEYPEGVAVMLFYKVGELFQDMAVNKSRNSIKALMDIRPDFAHLKVKKDTVKVSPEEVHIGDIILVKPGERVPLDGIIIKGKTTMDTSALTGESLPRELEEGNEALSGFINQTGVVEVEVRKEFGESTVNKILELVQNASNRKAKTENFITKFARGYTPFVVGAATLIAIAPPLFINGATFSEYIYRALVFLVISCPCALVISIPLGFFGGIGAASKNGILIKGSNYLEALNHVETVVFDKTGTLTKGKFSVTQIKESQDFTKEELLKYAASAESYSNHPIGVSIVKEYGKAINKDTIKDLEDIPGHGIIAMIDGKRVATGNSKLMEKENIKYHNESGIIGTIVHIAIDHMYAGLIVIEDTVKEDAIKGVKALKDMGIKQTIMLTGDHQSIADKVGKMIRIDKVYAQLLPHEKVERLEEVDKQKSPGKNIIFVGDGINDSPVLARADIGIAMGGLGSDAAIEAADIVIMTDEPSKIATAIRIAKRTQQIVWQNIVFALGIKAVVLLLGALGVATMWEAVFADVGVSILAILNSMRAMKAKEY